MARVQLAQAEPGFTHRDVEVGVCGAARPSRRQMLQCEVDRCRQRIALVDQHVAELDAQAERERARRDEQATLQRHRAELERERQVQREREALAAAVAVAPEIEVDDVGAAAVFAAHLPEHDEDAALDALHVCRCDGVPLNRASLGGKMDERQRDIEAAMNALVGLRVLVCSDADARHRCGAVIIDSCRAAHRWQA